MAAVYRYPRREMATRLFFLLVASLLLKHQLLANAQDFVKDPCEKTQVGVTLPKSVANGTLALVTGGAGERKAHMPLRHITHLIGLCWSYSPSAHT